MSCSKAHNLQVVPQHTGVNKAFVSLLAAYMTILACNFESTFNATNVLIVTEVPLQVSVKAVNLSQMMEVVWLHMFNLIESVISCSLLRQI